MRKRVEEEALEIVDRHVDYYMSHTIEGKRFGEVLNREGIEEFLDFCLEGTNLLKIS